MALNSSWHLPGHGRKDTLSSQNSLLCDTGRGRNAQGCCAPLPGTVLTPTSQAPWELSHLLPPLTNCWNKLRSYRCFHPHFTLLHFSSEKIRSSPASRRRSSATALGQHHSVGLETPFTPHRSSPWPSTARNGEKDSSAHDAAAPHSIPFQDLTLLPKGWARPRPTCSCWRARNTWRGKHLCACLSDPRLLGGGG